MKRVIKNPKNVKWKDDLRSPEICRPPQEAVQPTDLEVRSECAKSSEEREKKFYFDTSKMIVFISNVSILRKN